MGQTVGLKALTGVAGRCCFWGYLWTLTSKEVRFCEAPLPLSSHAFRSFISSAFSPFYSSFIFIPSSHHVEGTLPASCSCITSPNPPPSVCTSPVLIAPEIHSNGPEMYAGVQLTSSPRFIVPLFFTYCPFLKPCVVCSRHPKAHLSSPPNLQLQNQSELRAPTAEKAAFFLDAALAARSTSRPNVDEDERRNSHMLFTLHIYQYRMEKSGKGGS